MKLQSTADGLKADMKKVDCPHCFGSGYIRHFANNSSVCPACCGHRTVLVTNQPLEVKEQVREEALKPKQSVAQDMIDDFIKSIPAGAWMIATKVPDDADITWARMQIDKYKLTHTPKASNPELGVEEIACQLTDGKFPDAHNYLHSQPYWYKQGCIDAIKRQQQGTVRLEDVEGIINKMRYAGAPYCKLPFGELLTEIVTQLKTLKQ